jgi:hypothetical protein
MTSLSLVSVLAVVASLCVFPNRKHIELNGILGSPSSSETAGNHTTSETSPSLPLACARTDTVDGDHEISARVVCLFYSSCPPAVPRLVVPVVVDSVDAVIRSRAPAHIMKKVGIPFFSAPVLTHSDPASSVQVKLICGWIATALKHCAPYSVLDCFGSVDRVAMGTAIANQEIQFVAPTGSSYAPCHLRPADCFGCSAVAPHAPVEPTVETTGQGEDYKTVKAFPGEILELSHDAPPSSVLLEGIGAGVEGTRFSGATLALPQYATG